MKKHILLVEKDSTIIELLENNLKDNGYYVSSASNLNEAISKIRINPYLYSLCILDTDFSNGIKEGYSVCRGFKSNEVTKEIPLVLLTYRGGLQEIIEGLDTGVDIFILKPFKVDYLLERINLINEEIESRKQMKGVINLDLLKFLITLDDEGDSARFLLTLAKGFNLVVWSKIIPIMGLISIQVTLEKTKESFCGAYKFIDRFKGYEDGIILEEVQKSDYISNYKTVFAFTNFVYHFLNIVTTLTGDVIVDPDVLKKWKSEIVKNGASSHLKKLS